MEVVAIFLVVYLCVSVSTQNCEPTFKSVPIEILKGSEVISRTVTGCIQPMSIRYHTRNFIEIKVQNQVLSALNRGAVSNFPTINVVTITHNNIQMITQGAFFNLPSLKNLYLSHNHLKTVESYSFENLPSLKSIYLNDNDLNNIPRNTFVNLPRFGFLYLDNNNLKAFNREWLSSTPALECLILSNNQISYIENAAFQDFPLMETLDLLGNKLKQIHADAFFNLNGLGELMLSNNQLTNFDIPLKQFPKLYRLGLDRNKLTYLRLAFFDEVRHSLQDLYIFSNPLQCACIDELIAWGSSHNIDIEWKCKDREMYCVFPLSGETDCVKRSENEFNVTSMKVFDTECLTDLPLG